MDAAIVNTAVYEEPANTFSVPFTITGSRHANVLEVLVDRWQDALPETAVDYTQQDLQSPTDYIDVFTDILTQNRGRYALMSEFFLYDFLRQPAAEYRRSPVLEVDLAVFDTANSHVHCVEPKGGNLAQKPRDRILEDGLTHGTEALDEFQAYMEQFGWDVGGVIPVFAQHGKQGDIDVAVYEYIPPEQRKDART